MAMKGSGFYMVQTGWLSVFAQNDHCPVRQGQQQATIAERSRDMIKKARQEGRKYRSPLTLAAGANALAFCYGIE
jgi:hypothetical protein